MLESYRLECEIREHLRLVRTAKNPKQFWLYTWRPLLVKHRGEAATKEIARLMTIMREDNKK